MWQVSHPERNGTAWLMGSIHYGSAEFYPLPETITAAYDASDVLVVELNPDALNPEQVSKALREQGSWPVTDTNVNVLRQQTGEPVWQSLRERGKQNGFDAERFANTRPWLVVLQLVNLQLDRSRFTRQDGIDRHFVEAALGSKPIRELESFEQQMAVFSNLSDAQQVAFLETTLRDYEQGMETLDAMASAWKTGNSKQLEQLIFAAFHTNPIGDVLHKELFVERNRTMLASIDQWLAEPQQLFVVAGIGHMLGNDGLVCLLQQQGYSVIAASDSQQEPVCLSI